MATCAFLLAAMAGCGGGAEEDGRAEAHNPYLDREARLAQSIARLASPDPQQRGIGAGDLGKAELADASAYGPLRRVLLDDPDTQVRRIAAHSLRDTRYDATADLLRCLRTEREQSVRLRALESLGRRRDPAAIAPLAGFLASRRESVHFQEQVLAVLGAYGTEESVRVLCDCVRRGEATRQIREAALDRLAEQTGVAAPCFARILRNAGLRLSESDLESYYRDESSNGMRTLVGLYRSGVTFPD